MTKGILLAIKAYKQKRKAYQLQHADNPAIKPVRDMDWRYRIPTQDADNLFDDAVSGYITIGTQKFINSLEFKKFQSTTQRGGKEVGKQNAIKRFVRSTLPDDLAEDDFNTLYRKLEKAWKSGIPTLFRDAIDYSTKDQGYELSALPKAFIKYENGKWYVDAVLSNIKLTTAKEEHPIPGTITSRFVLLEGGFKLESYSASHPLLDDLCLKKFVKITDKLLAQQLEEHEFQKAVDSFQFSIDMCENNRKGPAQAVLVEIKRLKSDWINKPPLSQLTEVLVAADKILFAEKPEEVAEFKLLAAKIGKHSWGKILASAMLCLAGTVLVLASTIALGVTLGASAALSAAGIVAGGSIAAGGGVLLFKSVKKKLITEKMNIFMKAVQDPDFVVTPRKG